MTRKMLKNNKYLNKKIRFLIIKNIKRLKQES